MKTLMMKCKEFWQDEEGLTVIEYVIGAGLLVIAIGAMFTDGFTALKGKFEGTINKIS